MEKKMAKCGYLYKHRLAKGSVGLVKLIENLKRRAT